MGIYVLNIKDANLHDYDEVWAIMRSYKGSPYFKHVPELSPSWDLFKTYLSLRDSRKWDGNAFDQIYFPRFVKEMESEMAQCKLRELMQKSLYGNIAVCCTCANLYLCHRMIIGTICAKYGADVYVPNLDHTGWSRIVPSGQ